jgi:succinate dehydrogenase / fumarate reductase, cytochrome b subunit
MPASIRKRPKHLDLLKIRQPVPAIVSFLHRVSGALLFLAIPVALAMLQGSLASPECFARWRDALAHPLSKLLLIGFLWLLLHHFFAGLRYLALDLHKGIDLGSTRFWSKVVLYAGAIAALLIGVLLW